MVSWAWLKESEAPVYREAVSSLQVHRDLLLHSHTCSMLIAPGALYETPDGAWAPDSRQVTDRTPRALDPCSDPATV